MLNAVDFRRGLLRWYGRHQRTLPWRKDRDPYRVWVSEIMLQQTRVSAVIPFYERFLEQFPTVQALASAQERHLLAAWAGLGYYSRARNLQAAARTIAQAGEFPGDYNALRQLPGIGNYTAAAISSIAFGQPHAALDGNVMRVLSRVLAEPGDIASGLTRTRLQAAADGLLDPKRPGDYNQAIMELGATVCLPREPLCDACPVVRHCEARRSGRQREFPIKRKSAALAVVSKQLIIAFKAGSEVLFWQRPQHSRRLAGFWELPEPSQLPNARVEGTIGQFRHTIVNTAYRFEVLRGSIQRAPDQFYFLNTKFLHEVPLSTTAKKGLACLQK